MCAVDEPLFDFALSVKKEIVEVYSITAHDASEALQLFHSDIYNQVETDDSQEKFISSNIKEVGLAKNPEYYDGELKQLQVYRRQ